MPSPERKQQTIRGAAMALQIASIVHRPVRNKALSVSRSLLVVVKRLRRKYFDFRYLNNDKDTP